MFIEGKRKRIAYKIVKIYCYKVPNHNRTYNIIYKSTTLHIIYIFLKHPALPDNEDLLSLNIYRAKLSFLLEDDFSCYSSLSEPWKVVIGKTFSIDVGNVSTKEKIIQHINVCKY
jgi:hypothetical protein